MISFYTASKIWHATKHRELRDTYGLPVKARWIDLDDDSDIVQNRKGDLWAQCFEDVRDSDFVLVYFEDWEEEQRGALVEIGMAYGLGKPVYAIGECKSVSPCPESDVAFTHYPKWTWLKSKDLFDGALEAIALYTQSDFSNKRKAA